MSLVNDALKKARLEAARQDAARRGLPMPGAQLGGGARPSSQALIRAGAVAAVVLLALILFLAGRRFGSVEAPQAALVEAGASSPTKLPEPLPTEPSPAEPAPPPRVDTGPDRSSERPEPTAAASASPAEAPPPASAVTRPAPEATRPASQVARPASPPGGLSPVAETSAPSAATGDNAVQRRRRPEPRVRIVGPNSPAPAAAAEPPRSVARVLELPGAIRIELGGIAWSEQRPFALVNGRVVGPGDVVESLTVVAIAQRHVELEGEAGHFLLKLK